MIENIHGDIIRETALKYVHKSGVTVIMLPMKGYSTALAQFSVRFGSQDNSFSINGGEFNRIPDGTAHYLEHKLFESEEKDAFSLFAQTGAFCNAATSFDYTSYYFGCGNNFSKNLEILLNFVQEPYFTPENVEKERGIIAQEITMYRDNPGWLMFMNLLQGLYSKNPVRNDIAGTVESISQITDKVLYDCYDAFYNPANMILCAAGNFDPDDVVRICESKLKDRKPLNVQTEKYNEPLSVRQKRTELVMPVAKPMFEIAFKRPDVSGAAQYEDYICYNILFDMIFGGVSDFFTRMRENGSLNEEFSDGVFFGRGHLFPFARGESANPDFVLSEMQEELRRFKKNPPSKELFNCIKKATYGSLVREYNNVESVAGILTETALANVRPFATIDAAADADYDRTLEKLNDLDEENVCISIIKGGDQ